MAAKTKTVVDSEITKEEVIEETVKETKAPEKEAEAKAETEQTVEAAEQPAKEGFFKRTGKAIKNGWNSFEGKHPKLAKGLKVAGVAAVAGTVGYGIAKASAKKDDAVEIETSEPEMDLIECDDMYDDYEGYDVVDEAPVEEVESTVEVSEV